MNNRASCDCHFEDEWNSWSGRLAVDLCKQILVFDGFDLYLTIMFIYCLQILEGIATVIIGFLVACILPESLENASFFTEEERVFAGDYFQLEYPSSF